MKYVLLLKTPETIYIKDSNKVGTIRQLIVERRIPKKFSSVEEVKRYIENKLSCPKDYNLFTEFILEEVIDE